MENKLYTAIGDPYFSQPYIDEEGWRDTPVRHYFVHGGFRNTQKLGWEVRFCFYFPEKEKYEGRFHQYLSPAPENERASESLTGEEDRILFSLTHGAYYVISNQGGMVMGDGQRLYTSSANCAMFSRQVAQRVYGYEHRPYGYVYGGSGGSFKTMSCLEATTGVWDGAVPYVLANPMATPNVFCPRVRVMRLLGQEGMARVMDAMEPGGDGDIYKGLDAHQREALEEATKMGFPKRAWFCAPFMGDGSLMVLAPNLYFMTPDYFRDFWEKPGFAGSDPGSSEYQARVHFVSKVKALRHPQAQIQEGVFTNVDNSWFNTLMNSDATPQIQLEEVPDAANFEHCRIRILSGAAQGKEEAIEGVQDGVVTVSRVYDGVSGANAFEGLAAGDAVMLDNSDYLALQTFHRHQVPDSTYYVYDQFRDETGEPKYPQVRPLVGPLIAYGGGGKVPDGDIHAKAIAVCSLLDESALPWHGDWYRSRVAEKTGDEESWFRLYYNDNCIHGDSGPEHLEDNQHMVDYLGILHQALVDVAAWVEKGIEPAPTTRYTITDGQISVPDAADDRQGLQPVVHALANGEKAIHASVGEEVVFHAHAAAPNGTGIITEIAWDFEKTGVFQSVPFSPEDGTGVAAKAEAVHKFSAPGTYFPVVRCQAQRQGSREDIFTQCRNLDRVRVIVE